MKDLLIRRQKYDGIFDNLKEHSGRFSQIFALLELKVPRRQFHPHFNFFLAVLMLIYQLPNRLHPSHFEICDWQKLQKLLFSRLDQIYLKIHWG